MHKIPKSKRWADLDVSLNARQNSKAYPNVSRDNVEYGGLKKINICGIYTVKIERKKSEFFYRVNQKLFTGTEKGKGSELA